MNLTRIAALAIAVSAAMSPDWALSFTLTFENIPLAVAPPTPPNQGSGSAVLGFYNDDPVYHRKNAESLNTTFSDEALAICSNDVTQGCAGNFPKPPSGSSAVGSVSTDSFKFTVSPGLYLTALSFYYIDAGTGTYPGFQLFSDGTELLNVPLAPCGAGICDWRLVEVLPEVLAKAPVTSVAFLGKANSVAFDDVSLTTAVREIPEPSTYALSLLGLALVAAAGRRRKR